MGCYRVIIKSHLCNGAHCRACKSNEYSTHQTDATLAISILSLSSIIIIIIIIIFHGYATIYLRVICHGCFSTYIGAWQCLHNDEALILDFKLSSSIYKLQRATATKKHEYMSIENVH